MRILSYLLLIVAIAAGAVWFGRWVIESVLGGRVTDPTPEQRAEMARLNAPQVVPGAGKLPPRLPLELRLPWRVYGEGLGWVAWLVVGLLVLLGFEAWWARVLAGLGALLLLAILAIQLGELRDLWNERLVATAEGVELRRRDETLHRYRWAEVHSVRLVPVTTSYWRGSGSLNSRTVSVVGYSLTFLAADGQVLFRAAAPLRPADDYQALLDALPLWTGRPVLQERPAP